jgi:GlpG protein
MIRAANIEGTYDLRPLLEAMARQGIQFRVTEESGSQIIWVSSEAEVVPSVDLVKQWQKLREDGLAPVGGRSASLASYFPVSSTAQQSFRQIWRAPVTSLFILLAIIVGVTTNMGSELRGDNWMFYPEWMSGSAFNPLSYLQILAQGKSAIEYLQTLTPAFLHFGIVHILFNCLWIWKFGRMIEALQSSFAFVLVSIFIIYVSNTAQLLWSHSVFFGGLSGLVYGLLGYIWISQTLNPRGRLRLPNSMFAVMVGFMVLMAVVPFGFIANAAHIGGVVAGVIIGFPIALMQRNAAIRSRSI